MLSRNRQAKLNIIIGGGSGFAGQALASSLRGQGHGVTIISGSPSDHATLEPSHLTWEDIERDGLPPSTDAVINLAGSNMGKSQQLWACKYMQECVVSRAGTTTLLAQAIAHSQHPPSVSISTSPVGFYPASKGDAYEETAMVSDRDCAKSVMIPRRASHASDAANRGVRGVALSLH